MPPSCKEVTTRPRTSRLLWGVDLFPSTVINDNLLSVMSSPGGWKMVTTFGSTNDILAWSSSMAKPVIDFFDRSCVSMTGQVRLKDGEVLTLVRLTCPRTCLVRSG